MTKSLSWLLDCFEEAEERAVYLAEAKNNIDTTGVLDPKTERCLKPVTVTQRDELTKLLDSWLADVAGLLAGYEI